MEKFNLPRMKRKTAEFYNFYQIPKVLLQNKTFSSLDGWSILLFAMLFDRVSLSAENIKDFTDDNGDIFIIFTVEEAMEKSSKSKPVICKCFKQLEEIGLIERVRRGLGKPSIIYVNDFTYIGEPAPIAETSRGKDSLLQEVKNVDFKKSNNFTSRGQENLPQEVKNLYPNDTDLNNTEIIKTDPINTSFERFWAAYPKKKSKGDAERAWKNFNPNKELAALILEKVEAAKSSYDWLKNNGQYIPYPASWLNAKGWEDETGEPPVTKGGAVNEHSTRMSGGFKNALDRYSHIE